MKEIISVKKDIIFKTKISEITSLNLEHDYKINDDLVEGKLMLSGTYKMTEASLMEEEFLYNIPFSIAISDNIKKDTINIEIDDFKYETHKDVMKVNVDLDLECEEVDTKIEEIIESEIDEERDITNIENYENKELEMENNEIEIENETNTNASADIVDIDNMLEENNIDLETKINEQNINTAETINNITNSISNDENYHIYKVYIVRNGDTIESICNKYNLKIEDLKEYNDISNINVGDKIIIPQILND